MKQHPTIAQLNELSKEQREKLEDWANRDPFTKKVIPSQFQWSLSAIDLSIGKMIEFLDENERWLTIERTNEGWSLFEDPRSVNDRPELCDALWEAVKEVL